MSEESKNQSDSELKELIRQNIALSEQIIGSLNRVRSHIRWQNIWATIRLLIIIVPLVIGFFYLPPLIKQYLSSYQEILNQ